MRRDPTALEQATQAAKDAADARIGVFDLLHPSPEVVRGLMADYVERCYCDVQRLCERAWERGEIGTEGQTLRLPFAEKEQVP